MKMGYHYFFTYILNSWKPKIEYNFDIPLKYNYEDFELNEKEKRGALVYKFPKIQMSKDLIRMMLGKRPFECEFSYDAKDALTKYGTECILEFSGEFESGNIEKVIKVGEKEYNLYMRADTNTIGCF